MICIILVVSYFLAVLVCGEPLYDGLEYIIGYILLGLLLFCLFGILFWACFMFVREVLVTLM